jgi:hypothetical protein
MTLRARRKALKTMPKKLYDAFQTTSYRIENQSEARKQQGLDTLKWVFLAERQLSVNELQCALSIRPGDKQIDQDGFPTKKSIIDCCLGLVIIDESTSSVRLLHKSLQDYFEKQYEEGRIFQNGHEDIARTCLTYLDFNFDLHKNESRGQIHDYATEHWGHHIRKSRDDLDIETCRDIYAVLQNTTDMSNGFVPWYLSIFDERGKQATSEHSFLTHIPIHFD